MYKKYIVRLSEQERQVCQDVVKKLKGSSQKVRRAQILLKADADGSNWTDALIWAGLTGVGAAVAQLLASKGADTVWRAVTGKPTPKPKAAA